jgi:hypothetical protein
VSAGHAEHVSSPSCVLKVPATQATQSGPCEKRGPGKSVLGSDALGSDALGREALPRDSLEKEVSGRDSFEGEV